MITKESIIIDIKTLGIKPGDVVFIRGNMGQIGFPDEIDGKLIQFFLEAFLDVVGENGTIVTFSYTNLYLPWKLKDDSLFTKKKPSRSGGALTQLFLKYDRVVRSSHPSNSYVAIGKYAHEILDNHTPDSSAYSPFFKMMEFDAKYVTFGCLDTNPGFTIHATEEALGLTKKTLLKNINQVYYLDVNGAKKLFKRSDPGGCNYGAYRFYNEYYARGIMKIGLIGRALSASVNMKDCFQIEYELIKKNNGLVSCDNPNCIYCNLLRPRKKHIVLNFFLYRVWIILYMIVVKLIKKRDWKDVLRPKCSYVIKEDPIFKDALKESMKKFGELKF